MFKKKFIAVMLGLAVTAAAAGCGKKEESVVIYTNGDEEVIEAIENTLNEKGYEDKYTIQAFGTSELGGKLLAEGKDIEADLITMSSYYIESAQSTHSMFADLKYDTTLLEPVESYYAPLTAQEGCIIVNTEVLEEEGLTAPVSLKDLASPEYEGAVSIPDISSSSTGWLFVQAVLSEYGQEEGKQIISDIIQNCGPHLEDSGSGPIKKARAKEVAIAFGLRHQAVSDKADGLPIDYIDPVEGNFSLTESAAVVDKGDDTSSLAAEIANCIISNAREEIQNTYPLALYEGESSSSDQVSAYPRVFSEKLTVDLLEAHQGIFESCK